MHRVDVPPPPPPSPGSAASTVSSPVRPPSAANAGSAEARRRSSLDPLRLACHAAVELPFVVVCLLELVAGWTPTYDDAVFSWRAWNVLSAHPTLLGSPTHGVGGGGDIVFAPGPLVSWLLTVPVHLDPGHGSLWGSALIGAVGAGLAVEAARAATGRVGMVLGAGALLVLIATQVGVVLDPLWTPWIGAVWFLTVLAASWATACGRLGWWITVVIAASLAAQAHIIYALPAAGLCVVSLVIGLLGRRRSPPAGSSDARPDRRPPDQRDWRWVLVGLACGALVWLPTLVQQLADRPGNLTLIWRSSNSVGHVGLVRGLRGLDAVTRPSATWMHRQPDPGSSSVTFRGLVHGVYGSAAWWGGASLVLVLAVGVFATWRGRRPLAAAAWTAAAAGAMTVAAVARIPSPDAVEILYLDVVFVPVGIMVWLVMAGGIVEGATMVIQRIGGLCRVRLAAGRWRVIGGLALLAASAAAVVSVAGLVPSDRSEIGGPAAVTATATTTAAVAHAIPPALPFHLDVHGGPYPGYAFGVEWGAAYALFTAGRPVRLGPALQPYVGPWRPDDAPVAVSVVLDGRGRFVRVQVPLPVGARRPLS